MAKQWRKLGLAAGGDGGFVPAGAAASEGGAPPRQRFVKDMISVGLYTHPVYEWTLDVTTDRMDRWVAAFGRMREAGVDVEVVVDHSLAADDVRGYLVGMYRDGDTLFGIHEMVGEEAIALAQTVRNVSVLIERDFRDGKSTEYGEAITHSSIVQQPIVSGQSEFRPVAASRKNVANAGTPVFVLSTEPNTGAKLMTDEQIAKLREIMGAGDDLTADNALSRVAERFTGFADEKAALTKQIADLTAKVETLKADDKGEAASKIDPELIDDRAEATEERLDALAEKGKILPAVAASLKTALCGEPGKRNAYMLSKRLSKTDSAVSRQVIDALEQNDPVKLGEQTASQTRALSRQTPGETDDAPDPKDIEARGASARRYAGVKAE